MKSTSWTAVTATGEACASLQMITLITFYMIRHDKIWWHIVRYGRAVNIFDCCHSIWWSVRLIADDYTDYNRLVVPFSFCNRILMDFLSYCGHWGSDGNDEWGLGWWQCWFYDHLNLLPVLFSCFMAFQRFAGVSKHPMMMTMVGTYLYIQFNLIL